MRNIVVIFAFIQCCYAETVINSADEFQHFVYETGWRAHASMYVNHPKRNDWFKEGTYKDSIYKVIPQAIADCMQRKAEFENVVDIVTFKANDHTKYSYENWNAVVLWNYLEYAIHNGGALSNDGVIAVGDKIKEHYEKEYWGYINKAVSDIQAYAKDLNLYGYIKHLSEKCVILKQYNTQNKSGQFKIKGSIKYNNIIFRGDIFVTIEGGKVTAIEPEKAHFKKFRHINEKMEVSDEVELHEEVTQPLDIDKMLLDADKIHAFKNYINVPGQIVGHKCYMTATLTALYNSPRFRATIEKLANMPKEAKEGVTDWQVSVAIKKLFGIIEGKTDVKNQDELMAELIDRMERTEYRQKKEAGDAVSQDKIIGKSEYRSTDFRSPNSFARDVLGHINYEIEKSSSELDKICEIYSTNETRNDNTVTKMTDLNGAVSLDVAPEDNIEAQIALLTEKTADITRQITKLPATLFVAKQQDPNELTVLTCPEILELKTQKGIKKYKCVSTIQFDNSINHVVASIRTKQGWYEVDSLYQSVEKLGDKFIETLPNDQRALYYCTLIYEQIA